MSRAITLLGDKDYVGEKLARRLKTEFGVELLAMRRDYEPEYGPTAYNQLVGGARKIVETSISVDRSDERQLVLCAKPQWATHKLGHQNHCAHARRLSQLVDGRACVASFFDCQLTCFQLAQVV